VPSSISRRARLTASWRATKLVSAAAALIAGSVTALYRSVGLIENQQQSFNKE
jgi:hypothetical protein